MKKEVKGLAFSVALLEFAAGAALGRYIGAQDGWNLSAAAVSAVGLAACTAGAWLLGRKIERMREFAFTDTLTGVGNRRFMLDMFTKLCTQVNKRRKKMTLSWIDVNDFKKVNDVHGHAAGDAILQNIAQALTRSADKGEIVARWGGDEFIMICPYVERDPGQLAKRIDEQLSAQSGSKLPYVSVSVGTAVYPDDARTLDGLLRMADHNMFEAKSVCKAGMKDKQVI